MTYILLPYCTTAFSSAEVERNESKLFKVATVIWVSFIPVDILNICSSFYRLMVGVKYNFKKIRFIMATEIFRPRKLKLSTKDQTKTRLPASRMRYHPRVNILQYAARICSVTGGRCQHRGGGMNGGGFLHLLNSSLLRGVSGMGVGGVSAPRGCHSNISAPVCSRGCVSQHALRKTPP